MLNVNVLVVDKEFEELLPVLRPDEFKNLEQSILNNGLLDPIKYQVMLHQSLIPLSKQRLIVLEIKLIEIPLELLLIPD